VKKARDVAERVAARFEGRALQGYVRWKVRSDPAYRAVAEVLEGRSEPLVDIGCGVGLLPFVLRESGHRGPIIGIDFDERKIDRARVAGKAWTEIDFIKGDARDPLPEKHDVVMLDILQYFDPQSQQRILRNVAAAVGPGMLFVMRQGIRDSSWRYTVQRIVDKLAWLGRWMKAEELRFPSREEVLAPFAGFDAEVRPLHGGLPFNNFLFVLRRRP
jgi:SAM-dependent methyltransferase